MGREGKCFTVVAFRRWCWTVRLKVLHEVQRATLLRGRHTSSSADVRRLMMLALGEWHVCALCQPLASAVCVCVLHHNRLQG
jgi:hypothetical protein